MKKLILILLVSVLSFNVSAQKPLKMYGYTFEYMYTKNGYHVTQPVSPHGEIYLFAENVTFLIESISRDFPNVKFYEEQQALMFDGNILSFTYDKPTETYRVRILIRTS